jgi:hypothetical protein
MMVMAGQSTKVRHVARYQSQLATIRCKRCEAEMVAAMSTSDSPMEYGQNRPIGKFVIVNRMEANARGGGGYLFS